MSEVKTRLFRIDQRAFLFDMLTKHFTQRPIKQMGRRVIAEHISTIVWEQFHFLSNIKILSLLGETTDVQNSIAHSLGVFHLETAVVIVDLTGVTDLTSLLGVEVGTVQEQGNSLTTLNTT